MKDWFQDLIDNSESDFLRLEEGEDLWQRKESISKVCSECV